MNSGERIRLFCKPLMTGETKLDHNDRIVVGSTHIWIFQNPLEKGIDKKHYPPITYEYAQEEIAAKAGINIQVLNIYVLNFKFSER